MRAETGGMQFQNDWSGVFLRGDNALYYALLLQQISEEHRDKLTPIELSTIVSLQELFFGCREGIDGASVQLMRPFEQCRDGD